MEQSENTIIYNNYLWFVNYQRLARDIDNFLRENEMTPRELDEMLGKENVIPVLLKEDTKYGQDFHMRMGTFLEICNTCEVHPHDYIQIEYAHKVNVKGMTRGER